MRAEELNRGLDNAAAAAAAPTSENLMLAEFERNLIKERTVAGLDAARARGRKGGRPKRNPNAGKIALAKKFYNDHALSIPDILKTLNISKSTLYRWVDIAEGDTKKA